MRLREEARQREEAAAEYERHVAEYHRYMAAYERYEAKAAAAAEAERIAEEERAAVAAERAAAEAEEDAAEKYEQSATVTVFFGSSKAFSFGFLNESSVPPKINAILPQFDVVLPQFDVVLLQFRDLGLGIVFPQISDLGFAVSPKNGNSVLSDGVLADYGGDSAIDGAGRPPRKPPDVFLPGGDPCCLVRDRYLMILSNCPPAKPPDSFLCGGAFAVVTGGSYMPILATQPPTKPLNLFVHGGVPSFLTGDSCKMVMARRPPAKPPDVAVDLIPWWRQPDTAAWCKSCKRGRGLCRDMAQLRGKMLDPSFPWEWAKPKLLKGVGPCWMHGSERRWALLFHLCFCYVSFISIFMLFLSCIFGFWGLFHSIVASRLVSFSLVVHFLDWIFLCFLEDKENFKGRDMLRI